MRILASISADKIMLEILQAGYSSSKIPMLCYESQYFPHVNFIYDCRVYVRRSFNEEEMRVDTYRNTGKIKSTIYVSKKEEVYNQGNQNDVTVKSQQ